MNQKDNNGLYTNEWLLADTKTNEIAMFEMGTTKSKLYRSSKGEWFGGTPGFYWGCNNAKDLNIRLDTLASVEGRPANVVWWPQDRDRKWLRLYEKWRGKIDAAFAKEAFTTPPICSASALDAKFTTTALAQDLKSWALFGPPARTELAADRRRKADLPGDSGARKQSVDDPPRHGAETRRKYRSEGHGPPRKDPGRQADSEAIRKARVSVS